MKKSSLILILLFTVCGVLFSANDKFVVVIDPGHGGRDAGAVRGSYKEKEINLGVALALGELIEKNMKDVKVVYTRKGDSFVALDQRANIANKAKANLFISIHTNSTAARKTTAAGADTYILGLSRTEENLAVAKRENSVIMLEDDYTTKYEGFDPNSPESYIIFEFMTNKYRDQSLDFAGYIQRDFKGVAKRADRGVREAGFLVLRKTSMPSVLIELGFINNDSEAKFLATKSGQRTMATAIYSGFKDYKRNFDKMQGKVEPVSRNIASVLKEQPVKNLAGTDVREESEQWEDDMPDSQITPVSKSNSSSAKQAGNEPEYRVQFLYSRVKLPVNSSEFKGLSPDKIEYYIDNGFKYTYGLTGSLREAERAQTEVRKKFKDAFVIIQNKNTRNRKDFFPLTGKSNAVNEKTTSQQTGGTNKTNIKEDKVAVPAPVSSIKKDEIEYRVQFLISPNKLPEGARAFKGLSPVDYYVESGYKYTYGSSASMSEIQKIQTVVRKKFPDAFIVKLKNGKRVK
jgi:N-acetylmuramoyl-L-alanine amidase